MNAKLKQWIKNILVKSGVDLTKNIAYDRLTQKILKKNLRNTSSCMDIGAHKGEITDIMMRYAPEGKFWLIEPIPFFAKGLKDKYAGKKNVFVYNLALGNENGEKEFHWVKNYPAYSGFFRRQYDHEDAEVEIIKVKSMRGDDLVGEEERIDFMKIDVEGAEYFVLQGCENIISNYKPSILFEFGMGAADVYGVSPEMMYDFFKYFEYDIFTLDGYLKNQKPLTFHQLEDCFFNNKEYYFFAKSQKSLNKNEQIFTD